MDFKELDELRKKKRKQNDEFAAIDRLRYPDKGLSLDLESLNRSYDNAYKSGTYDFDAAREYNTSYIDSVRKIQNYAARNTLDNKTKSDLDNLLSSLDKQQSALSDLSSAHRAERQFIEQFPSKSSYNVYRASVGDYDEYSDLIQENEQELKDYKKEHGGKIKNILNRYNVHDSESADAKEEEYKRNMGFINRNKADTQRIREIFEQDIKENKYNKLTDEQKADIDRYVEAKQKYSGIADQQMLMGLVDKNYSMTSDSLSAFQEMKEAEENIKDIPEWELLSQYAQREKNRVEMERTLEKTGEMANKHQVLSTIGSVAYTPAKIVALKQVLADYNNDVFGVDVNSPYFAPTQISGKIRDSVMEEHGNTFDFVYSTAVSLLDSAASAAMGGGLPVVGGAIIGSSAAAESMLDAAERGLDPKSVLATGLMSGIFETFFESISIAKFKGLSEKSIKNLFSVKGLKTALGNVAKSASTNALEETFTEIADIAYDTISNGDFSNFKRLAEHYISEGKAVGEQITEEEAKKLAIKDLTSQVIQAGAGGALQGVLGGVGASAIGALRQDTVDYKAVGEQIKGTDFAQRGMEYAKEIGGEALKRADKAESYSKALNYIDESSSLYKAIEGREKSNLGKMAEANAEDLYNKMQESPTVETENAELKTETSPEKIKEFTQPKVEGGAYALRMIEKDGIKQFYLSDAQTVPVSEANINNPDVANVYNAANDYEFDTARYFIAQAARAENLTEYISAFDAYYKSAAEGTPIHFFEQYQNPKHTLSQEVKEKVYQLGTEKFKEALSTKEGVQLGEGSIRQSGELGEFGVADSWAISAVGNVAKATGVNFVVFSDEDSSYNGWYDAKNNEIYVNLKGDYSIVQTAGHELTHFIRERNEEGYQALKNFLLKKYKGAGGREAIYALVVARQEAARNNKEKPRELIYDEALEEVVAESCQNMLKDTSAIQELAKQNKTLFEYIKEWIEGFVRSIKEAFKGVDKISAEYEWLTAIMNDTAQLQEIWDKALVGAVTDSKTLEKSQNDTSEVSENEIKRSDRDPNLTRSNEQNEKVIARLNETVQTLEKQLKLTHGLELDKKGVEKIARKLIKESGTTYSVAELSDTLMSTYDNYRKGLLDGEDFFKIIRKTAEEMYNRIDGYILDDNQEALNYLKNCRFRLSESQKTEVKAMNDGSTAGFRDSLFGSVVYTIDKSAPTLDALWSELNGEFPHLFPDDTTDRDMPGVLVDVIDELRTPYYEELEYYKSDIIENLNLKLLEQYFEAPIYKTFADKQNERRLKDMARLKKEYDARIERYKQAKKDLREKVKEERRIGKEKLKEYKTKQKATANKRKYIDGIESVAKELSGWYLNPKQGKSIPKALADAIQKFISSINFEKGKLNNKGEVTRHDRAWRDVANDLKTEVVKAKKNFDFELPQYVLDVFESFLEREDIKNKNLYDLDEGDLETLYKVFKTLKRSIQSVNRFIASEQKKTIGDAAQANIEAWQKKKPLYTSKDSVNLVRKQLYWNTMNSFTYFNTLGSSAESIILKQIDFGQRAMFDKARIASDYLAKTLDGVDSDNWSGDKAELHTFRLMDGDITMTTAQLMTLYELSKREQALGHILGKGIVANKSELERLRNVKKQIKEAEKIAANNGNTLTAGKKDELILNGTKATRVTEAELRDMLSKLTAEQKSIADKLQYFLVNETADWGNETTQKECGVDMFTEPDYFPMESNKDFVTLNDTLEQNSLYAIANQSFTKSTVKGANNPLTIRDIFDVWGRHTSGMAAYNGLALPLRDAMRWLNYRGKAVNGKSVSLREEMRNTFGDDAISYYTNLISDINGSSISAHSEELIFKFIGNAKSAAVTLNASVAAQQACAYFRAAAVIDPKYLVRNPLNANKNAQLAKKYCPIAWWKSEGHYETDIGRGMVDIILNRRTTFEKAKDIGAFSAQKADELTWGILWGAVEAEILDTTDLKRDTEEFYKSVGDRLGDIINQTQVVDTVLHRNQSTRSRSGVLKGTLLTFVSEPIANYNLMLRAIQNGDKKLIARCALSVALSNIAAAAIASLIYALRDNDEDKDFFEKWREYFTDKTLDSMNPFTIIPFMNIALEELTGRIKGRITGEGYSWFSGNDSMELQWIYSGYRAADNILEYIEKASTYTPTELRNKRYDIVYNSAKFASQLTGIGIHNLIRDGIATWNAFSDKNIGYNYKVSDKYISMVESLDQGDKKAYDKIYSRLQADGYTDDVIQRGIQSVLKDDERIKQASQARQKGEIDKLDDIRGELETKGFEKETVIKAIDSVYNQETKGSSESKEKKDTAVYKNSDLINALDNGYIIHAKKVIEQMKSEGKEGSSIRSAVTQKYKEKYFELKYEAYVLGNKEAEKKITELKEMLNSLDIGYDYSVYRDWDKKYYEWKQVNK